MSEFSDIGRGQASSEPLYRTIAEAVTDKMRVAILHGELAPGQRIKMQDLIRRYGVSHVPIREALRQLETEGLVENYPQRGASIRPVSLKELGDVYDLRRLIESETTVRAMPLLTPQNLNEAKLILDRLDQEADEPGMDSFLHWHHAFHLSLMEPAINPIIRHVLDQLWPISERYVRLAISGLNKHVSAESHRNLYLAVTAGDALSMRLEVDAHLRLTEDLIRRWHHAKQPPGF